jgi:phage shock protein E
MNSKVTRFILAVFAAIALATPTLAAPPNWPSSVDTLIAKERQGIPTIDMAQYLKVVQDPKGAMILDVREPEEFAAGHVPGAVNMPRGLLEFGIWKMVGYPGKVDYERTIYVQCLTGARATFAARRLKDMGFKHPVIVLMDFRVWEKDGNPVVK